MIQFSAFVESWWTLLQSFFRFVLLDFYLGFAGDAHQKLFDGEAMVGLPPHPPPILLKLLFCLNGRKRKNVGHNDDSNGVAASRSLSVCCWISIRLTPADDGNDDDANEAAIKLPDQMSLLEIVLVWIERMNKMTANFVFRHHGFHWMKIEKKATSSITGMPMQIENQAKPFIIILCFIKSSNTMNWKRRSKILIFAIVWNFMWLSWTRSRTLI